MQSEAGTNYTEAGCLAISPCIYCQKDGANSICSKCFSAQYCNRTCQQAHWKKHKESCMYTHGHLCDMEQRKLKIEECIKKYEEFSSVTECPVCHEHFEGAEKVQLPVCHHFLCVECISKRINVLSPSFQCPLCPRNSKEYDLVQFWESLIAGWQLDIGTFSRIHFRHRAIEYATIAQRQHTHLIAILKKCSPGLFIFGDFQCFHDMKAAELSMYAEDYTTALQLAKPYTKDRFAITDPANLLVLQTQSSVCQAVSKFELGYPVDEVTDILNGALQHLQTTLKRIKKDKNEAVVCWVRLLRACMWVAFGRKNYQEVIVTGTQLLGFLDSGMEYKGYDMLARAYIGLGEYEKARNTVRRGIRYDTPWDKEMKQYLQGILGEIDEAEAVALQVKKEEAAAKGTKDI